jgi:NADPH2:quinone reductase
MKAAFIVDKSKIEFKEIETPSVDGNDVLVKVRAMGICGTDLHFLRGVRKVAFPHLSGHEASGEVVATGPLVDAISVGDRVAIDPNIHCGQCWYCRRGRFNLCQNKKVLGVSLPGCFSEYVKIKQDNVWKLPDSVTYWQGALIEPLSVALHAFNTSNTKLGENVALFGAGTIGLMLVQLLKKSGAHVTAIDKIGSKLDKALQLGADRVINLSKVSFQSVLDENAIYNKVIDAAGVAETLETSVELAGAGGEVIWLGLPSCDIQINPARFLYRELTLHSSLAYTHEFGDALQLIGKGEIELEPLLTHQVPFSEISRAFELQSQGASIKSVLED